MRVILKFKWLVLALWVLGAVGLMVTAPNMAELVRTKGQITVPDGYTSTIASELEKEIGSAAGGSEGMSTVLTFHRKGG